MFTHKQHIQQAGRTTETNPKSSYAHESRESVQKEAPDFDPDINGISSPSMYEIPDKLLTQGTASPAPKTTEPEIKCSTPAMSTQ